MRFGFGFGAPFFAFGGYPGYAYGGYPTATAMGYGGYPYRYSYSDTAMTTPICIVMVRDIGETVSGAAREGGTDTYNY